MLGEHGNTEPILDSKNKELNRLIEEWASQGFRTLTVAIRELPVGHKIDEIETLCHDMTLVGVDSRDM